MKKLLLGATALATLALFSASPARGTMDSPSLAEIQYTTRATRLHGVPIEANAIAAFGTGAGAGIGGSINGSFAPAKARPKAIPSPKASASVQTPKP